MRRGKYPAAQPSSRRVAPCRFRSDGETAVLRCGFPRHETDHRGEAPPLRGLEDHVQAAYHRASAMAKVKATNQGQKPGGSPAL